MTLVFAKVLFLNELLTAQEAAVQNVVFILFVKNKRRRTITSSAGVDVNM